MASDTVVQAFWTGFRRAAAEVATNLRAGVEAANVAVRAKQQSDAALAEMGSTLVAALVPGQRLYWASVGDSGLWLFRAGQLRRLNEDHSMRPLLFDLVELGRMTREEALADPRAHHLRSAITGRDLPPVEIAADGYRLKADDVVLLASDGLEVLSEARISGLNAQRGNDARGLARALLDAVDEASGQDNLDPRQHGSARSLTSAPVGRLLASVNLSLPLVETECPSLEEETRRQLAQARQEQVQALQRERAAATQRVRPAHRKKKLLGRPHAPPNSKLRKPPRPCNKKMKRPNARPRNAPRPNARPRREQPPCNATGKPQNGWSGKPGSNTVGHCALRPLSAGCC